MESPFAILPFCRAVRNFESVRKNHLFFVNANDVAFFRISAVDSGFGFIITSFEHRKLAFQNSTFFVQFPSTNVLVTFTFEIISNFTSIDVLLVSFSFEDDNVIVFEATTFGEHCHKVSNIVGTVTSGARSFRKNPTLFNCQEFSNGFLLFARSECEDANESDCDNA